MLNNANKIIKMDISSFIHIFDLYYMSDFIALKYIYRIERTFVIDCFLDRIKTVSLFSTTQLNSLESL